MNEPSTTDTTATTRTPGFLEAGRHPVNIGHLVMGIAFTGLALVWLLHQGPLTDNESLRWLMPVPWVLAGAAGLVATAIASRRRHATWQTTRQTGWVDRTEES